MDMHQGAKRFYKAVSVAARPEGGFGVMLDRFNLRTPARAILAVPTNALAEAIAAEWDAQGEHVLPVSMPITRLANLAQDRGQETAAALADEIAAYAGSDLVCYRTPAPAGLNAKQVAHWDPMLDWLEAETGHRLFTSEGLIRIDQPDAALKAIHARAAAFDHWALTAATFVTGLAGSAVIGLMMQAGALSAEAALAAIRIEEDWNAAIWGRDDEEAAQAASRLADLQGAEAYFAALASDHQAH